MKKEIAAKIAKITKKKISRINDFASKIEEAKKFVDDFGDKYISCRIRDGYVGREVFTEIGEKYIQATRGRPRGTLISIKGEDGKVHIGISYLHPEDKESPIIGLAEALKNAIKAKDNSEAIGGRIKQKDEELLEYFICRCHAYWYPEIYSYSRGEEGKKVKYPYYEKVHKNRKFITKEN